MKVVTVASYNSELALAIDNGTTGYLCRTNDDWKTVLENLIADKEYREQIGSLAYEKVMQQHTTLSTPPGLLNYMIESPSNSFDV